MMKFGKWRAFLVVVVFAIACVFNAGFASNVDSTQDFASSINWENVGAAWYDPALSNAVYHYFAGDNHMIAVDALPGGGCVTDHLQVLALWVDEKENYYPLLFTYGPCGERYEDFGERPKTYTDEELQELLEFTPIAYDAFVFMVNESNPIQAMSTDILQRIYTGELTNWQTLGGVDAEIVAFQRSCDVYSQLMMEYTFMPDLVMADPPVQYLLPDEDCPDVMPMPLGYDNDIHAIGYTMYRYFNHRYGADQASLLAIDGVAPTAETIREGIYPYVVTCYAVYPKATPAEHPLRALVAWLLTEEGQELLSTLGLTPCMELEATPSFDIPLVNRQSSGTAHRGQKKEIGSPVEGLEEYELIYPGGTHMTCYEELVTADPSVRETIEAWLAQAEKDLRQRDSANAFLQQDVLVYYFYYQDLISVHASLGMGYDTLIRTAVFDTTTGNQLQLSDIFFEDVNYIDHINQTLVKISMQVGPETLGAFEFTEQYLKKPFYGLAADYASFVVSQQGTLCIAFPGNNPYVFPSYWQEMFLVDIPLYPEISPYGSP